MTYGFEIEGLFLADLKDKLSNKWAYKLDGSVSIGTNERIKFAEKNNIHCNPSSDNFIRELNENFLRNNNLSNFYNYTELNSPVYNNLPKLLKALSSFEFDKNWLANNSCGIHIHIGFKNDNLKKLDISDFGIISSLQDYASENLCACVKERIKNNRFCMPYQKNFKDAYLSFKQGEKYSFMGNHSSGTFEFRFFSACKHKDENAKLFFNYLNRILKDYRFNKRQRNLLKDYNEILDIKNNIESYDRELKLNETIKSNNNVLTLNFNIKSNTEKIEALTDRGNLHYQLDESNPYFDLLSDTAMRILSYRTSARVIPIPSLTSPLRHTGYHNNCQCPSCLERRATTNNCGQEHCDTCENTCNYRHCDECGTSDFCERESCGYCQDENPRRYNAMFGDNN